MAKNKSGGEPVRPADNTAPVGGDKPEGAALAPAGPGDQPAARTDTASSVEQTPPEPQRADQATVVAVLHAQLQAMAEALRKAGVDPEPIYTEATARALGTNPPDRAAAVRRATVSPVGGPPMEVEYPADAKDPTAAAVAAYKDRVGVWSLPHQPHVEHHTD